jgi:hypothetical protein
VARVTGGIQNTGVSYGDSTANIQLDGLVELVQQLKDFEAVDLQKELKVSADTIGTQLIQSIGKAYPVNPLSGWGGPRTSKLNDDPKGIQKWRQGGRLQWIRSDMVAGLVKQTGLKRIKGGKAGNIGVGVSTQSRFLTIVQKNAAASVFEFAGGVSPNSNLGKAINSKFGTLPRKPMWRTIDANLNKIESSFKDAIQRVETEYTRRKNTKGLG